MFNNKNQKMKNLKTILLGSLVIGSLAACSSDDDNGGDNTPPTADSRTELYASNNNNGNITVFDLEDGTSKTLLTASLAAEGIYYDADADAVTQASRSNLTLDSYADASVSNDGITLTASLSSEAVLENPRAIAVSGDFYVVADSEDVDGDEATADGRYFIFQRTDSGFTLRNTVTVDFKVWEIAFVGADLYAVVDATNEVALFSNFLSTHTTDVSISADKRVAFEGIVRTHGMAYDGTTMILTDIGAASGDGADTDGGFHVVSNFTSKFSAAADGGMVAVTDQVRVAGESTLLGNPISAEYDAESNTVFIAEIANGGGRVVSFVGTDFEAGGDVDPATNVALSSASSVYFYKN